ncbi:hypothetical protein RhiirA4_450620 [Rhizophagus irregularis]|uniref:Uncharacterized protein n=1 Tax=Rhizophagus irregularis TaxID=588596 RepID=A0A2I1FTK8_9GLOM|nr:hypothetical protein RhiirA4_450620 [Rhizophagus irregularis]
MFDAKLDAEKIRKRYSWQAYKKLGEKDKKSTDYEIVKKFIGQYGGRFAKIHHGRRYGVPTATSKGDNFVDAQSSPLSTIPRSKEEHEELDNLNSNFTSRLEEITVDKGKASVKTTDLKR